MKEFIFTAALVVFLTGAFSVPGQEAQAQEIASTPKEMAAITPGNASVPVNSKNMPIYLDADLANKNADFTQFARNRVHALSRNHIMAKSRMKITKQADGSFLARYHTFDQDSMNCKVRRSSSKTIPYVAVVRFKEIIMQAVGITPDECRHAKFVPVEVIPNRQIFSYKKGTWQ